MKKMSLVDDWEVKDIHMYSGVSDDKAVISIGISGLKDKETGKVYMTSVCISEAFTPFASHIGNIKMSKEDEEKILKKVRTTGDRINGKKISEKLLTKESKIIRAFMFGGMFVVKISHVFHRFEDAESEYATYVRFDQDGSILGNEWQKNDVEKIKKMVEEYVEG